MWQWDWCRAVLDAIQSNWLFLANVYEHVPGMRPVKGVMDAQVGLEPTISSL